MGKRTVHADGDVPGAGAKPDAPTILLDAASKGDVFKDFSGDSGVAADGVVGQALNEQELAIGGGDGRLRIVNVGK